MKYMRIALFSVVMQRVVLIPYRRFGTTCRFTVAGVYPVEMCHFYRFGMSSLSSVVTYIDLSTFAAFCLSRIIFDAIKMTLVRQLRSM
jgi:hypothetical protein